MAEGLEEVREGGRLNSVCGGRGGELVDDRRGAWVVKRGGGGALGAAFPCARSCVPNL